MATRATGTSRQINIQSGNPGDCYSGNTEIGGGPLMPASSAAAQTANADCGNARRRPARRDPSFLNEVLCDAQVR